jgi:hypothetical protein
MTDDLSTPARRLLFLRSSVRMPGMTEGSEILADLLTRLGVPSSLLGGKRVASQACSLLRESLRTLPPERRPKISEYIRELRWMIHHAEILAAFLFYNEEDRQPLSEEDRQPLSEKDRQLFLCCSGRNPYLRGGASDHGLCCLLWEQYSRHGSQTRDLPNLQRPYDALRREALLTHITALGYWAQREDWLSPEGPGTIVRGSMYRRTLAIRHFTMAHYLESTEYRNVLRYVPVVASRAKMHAALRQIHRNLPASVTALEKQLHEDLGSILGLLRVADDPTSIRAYTKEAETEVNGEELNVLQDSKEANEEVEYEVECQDDEDEANETGESIEDGENNSEDGETDAPGVTYTRRRWPKEDKKNCIEAGIHPADALPIQHLHLSVRRYGDSLAWQAMRNQNLSLDWRNLAMEELGIALQILETQAGCGLEELEIFALATIVVARGLTLPTAQSMDVRGDRPDEVEKLTLFLPASKTEQAEWLVPAVPIPYQQEHGTYAGCRQVVKSFVLPDYWHTGNLLRRLIAMKFPLWNGELLQPFAGPTQRDEHPATYAQRLEHFLRKAKSDRGPSLAGRVTYPRLAGVLPQRIRDQTAGNLVLMTYATLQKDRTGEDGRFYASPAVQSVQQADLAATLSIAEELRVIGYDASVDLALKPSSTSGYLGSPMCPTLEAIQVFLAELVAKIAAANNLLNAHEDINAFIARHNAFTMLTFCAVTVGTCHRPTHGTIPDLAEIDTSTGRVSIVDKGTDKARLSVAAESSVTQLRAYVDYVMSFDFGKFFGSRPELSFFFISHEREFVAVSPATLKQQSLPFVANFARHLVKTILSEWCESGDARVSQEWIAALLGHFMEGEEPFGAHSSLDYKSFAESMRAALGALLTAIQFQAIDILGKRIDVHAS